jgi:hypothetical protein
VISNASTGYLLPTRFATRSFFPRSILCEERDTSPVCFTMDKIHRLNVVHRLEKRSLLIA